MAQYVLCLILLEFSRAERPPEPSLPYNLKGCFEDNVEVFLMAALS